VEDLVTQNFFEHKTEIQKASRKKPRLTIDIDYDPQADSLTVADDANGMNMDELRRAVQLNRPPPNRSGRSEFGMGLKMAACWLGSRWSVTTKRLGSTEEYEVLVDVGDLQKYHPDSVDVLLRSNQDANQHYTRIEVTGMYRRFRGQAITRIKEHLSSIYRRDIASGEVLLRWNGEPLTWEPDPVFEETKPNGKKQIWKKSVSFKVRKFAVKGNVWLRIPGQARRAGMHLFRRGRLVIGGPGEGYKPEEIFVYPQSFQSQRLVGELDLDNWPVTQTKDSFDWAGELEHEFILKLNEAVADYVDKAVNTKSDEATKPTKADAQLAGDATKDVLSDPAVDTAMMIVESGPPPLPVPDEEEIAALAEAVDDAGEPTRVAVGSEGLPELDVWFLEDRPETEIYAQFACPDDDVLQLAVNLNHPFVVNNLQRDPQKLQLWAQMLYVDALLERGARRRGGNLPPNAYRQFKDAFLRRLRP